MMRTAEDLLQELTALDESHRIEAKQAHQIDRSVMETVCAFANEPGLGGGYLLLGVRQNTRDLHTNTYQIEGINNPDKLQADLASQCATSFNHPIRPRVSVETLSGKTVVVVYVPESAPTEKPIYVQKLGLPRGAYRRIGSTDQEGTEDDLVALYTGHQLDPFDATVLSDADMQDIDPAALSDYRQLRRAINPDADELSWSDEDLLRALGCAKRDDERLKPTVAGVVLFGTSLALRRCFPMMRIDYIRVPGKQWVENPDHRFDTLEIRAPLLTAIRRATNTVRDELIQSFSLPEGALSREDESTLPLRVIREAIVNAVMHRSYRIHGAIQIIRYTNRLEIRNPGHSIKAEEQLGEPGSEARNPRIAAVLHDLNIAETKGSGIRAMRELMLAQGLLPPTFESSRHPDLFVATFLFHHLLDPNDVVWLRSLTSEPLDNEESRALIFVRERGAIDNAAYRSINGKDTLNASHHLRRLRDLNLLQMKGSGSRTYYIPSSRLSMDTNATTQTNFFDDPNTHQLMSNTHQSATDTHQLLANLPAHLRARIPLVGTKPRKETLRALIRDLCAWRALSARDIAIVLGGRDHKHLVREFLSPMVRENILAHTIPHMDNHPDQRYTIPLTTITADTK